MNANERLRRLIGAVKIGYKVNEFIQDYIDNPNFDINGSYNNETALSTAIKNGDIRSVDLLLSVGASPLAKSGRLNKTPYEIATEQGQIFIRELIYRYIKNSPMRYHYISGVFDCPICLNDNNEEFVQLNECGHIFHKNCIDTWGRTTRTCPNCRGAFFGFKRSKKRSRKRSSPKFIKTTSSGVLRYQLYNNNSPVSWSQALKLAKLPSMIAEVLKKQKKESYFFECIPYTVEKKTPFEFKITFSKDLTNNTKTEIPENFKNHLGSKFNSFKSLSGETILISPGLSHKNFSDLRNFIKNSDEIEEMLKFVLVEVKKCIKKGFKIICLSTHGFGVPWLHFRIEQFPKYYSQY